MSPLQMTMWPPSATTMASAGFGAQTSSSGHGLNLERCARLLPHDNDTGGFFLALFEKVAEIPGTSERLATACAPTELAGSDLVPLEQCTNHVSKLRDCLTQLGVSQSEGRSAGGARVWASVDGSGNLVRAPVDMPSAWVEDGSGGNGAPGVIAAGLPLP
jgi:hypothetical protein